MGGVNHAKFVLKSTFFGVAVTLKLDGWPWNTIGIIFNAQWSCLHDFITISRYWLDILSENGPKPQKSTFFGVAVTLKFDQWPWKTIGILSSAFPSYVHDFIVIGQIKLELSSGNGPKPQKWSFFGVSVTLKFDELPWKTIGTLSSAFPSYVHDFIAIGQIKLELSSGNGAKTLKSGQNCLFLARVTLIFNGWPWKLIGILFHTFPSHMHGFRIIGQFKLDLRSGNG